MSAHASEVWLDAIAGLAELVKPFGITDQASIAATTAGLAVFAGVMLPKGREGLLLAYAFEGDDADFTVSPVVVCEVTSQDSSTFAAGEVILGPFKHQIGSLAAPVALPFIAAPFLKPNTGVGLARKNAQATASISRGFVYGISWQEEQRRTVRDRIAGMPHVPWPPGAVFGDR